MLLPCMELLMQYVVTLGAGLTVKSLLKSLLGDTDINNGDLDMKTYTIT